MRRGARFNPSSFLSSTVLILASCAAALPLGCGSGETSGSGGATTTSTGGSGGTGGSTGGSGGTGGEQLNCVLDGTKTDTEECDDGNDVAGDGCELDCSFTCVPGTPKGDAKCDDTDPCNGVEKCTDAHLCVPGTVLADGTACGAAKICRNGACLDDVCGDLFVSAGEQCDDGNTTAGDGCDPDCTYSCTAADPSKCAPADACAGAAACDGAAHTCLPLVPLADGTACAGGFCLNGACKSPSCGDGVPDPGEECDDGNAIDGDGCDTACVFSCAAPAVDCPAPAECEMAICTAQHTCDVAPDPAKEGVGCAGGPGFTCKSGACTAPNAVCGDGAIQPGEDCDFGAGNGPGTGCESSCQFSCSLAPDDCSDNNPCNGVEACAGVMVNGHAGQKCQSGQAAADCTACPGGLCGGGLCKASSCGDGCVDAGVGEECEPPNQPTCDAVCHTILQPVCGNAAREAGEQCDDGNVVNLDGCDGACAFEQDQRINWFKMQFGTEAFCPVNQLGGAFTGGLVQSQVQQGLDAGIANGSVTILFKMMGLDDLTGTADPMVGLGVMSGAPFAEMGGPVYDGTADLDWWHIVTAQSIDPSRNPLELLPGSISAKVITAGPGAVTLVLPLGGGPAALKFTSTMFTAAIGATSTPLSSAGSPPGHLASEHLDPALTSYASMGQPTAAGAGKLCGNVAAASLALVPIPMALVGGFGCSQGYTLANSILDVLVGGCNILAVQQIKPTQPDQVDPAAMPAGAGAPYTLSASPATRVVSTCRDKNNAVVPLQACLSAAAYSAFFKFTTDRVIVK